ncbi:CACNA1G [Symbiodinium natans]|uniref:CACNA1G protein n=1 Tax=Symbiodinium natans TaxID=878477 RepID=A0A812R914_9DINO|nr:CACNA1G [Symbiodinium natans]
MPRFFRDPGEDSEASEIPAGIHGVPDTSAIDPVPADAEEYITIAGGGDGEETAEPSSSFALDSAIRTDVAVGCSLVLVWSEDGSLREIQELRLPSDFKALQLSVDYHNCLDLARGRSGKWVRSSVTYGLPLDSEDYGQNYRNDSEGTAAFSKVMAPLMEISPLWVALFLFYICFTYFAVLNVVTGVFCQTAIESAQNDHAAVVHSILKNKQAHIKKIRALFSCLGDDQTGIITFAMFEEKINSPAVKAYFEVLGLDVWDAWSFFKLLDLDDGGDVEIEEFLMGCLRLRGTARAIDVNKLIHDQTWLIRSHGKFQTYVEVELKKIQEQLLWMAGLSPPEQSYTLGSLSSSTGSGSCGLRNSRQRPSQRSQLATPDTKDS